MGLEPGAVLERYEIVRLVGRGGMGEVYHAIDTKLRRPVALKVLRADTDQSEETGLGGVARLMREARAAAALNHPNSVQIYELGEAQGVHFIAMELVNGESFRRHSQPDRPASVEVKVGWLVDASRALWAAHKAGIIHRDIKPSNIMVSEEGVVKVLDFGLAKPQTAQSLHHTGFHTVIGQVMGTPRYMAPEQLEGSLPDARSDQFAFGLTAYELLCGEYAGGPLVASIPPLHEVSGLIAPELSKVVAKMLQPHKEHRYGSMEEVAHALRNALPAVRAHRKTGAELGFQEHTLKHAIVSDAPAQSVTAEHRIQAPPSVGTVRMAAAVGPATPLPLPAASPGAGSAPKLATLPLQARPLAVALPPAPSSQPQLGAAQPQPGAAPPSMGMPPSIGDPLRSTASGMRATYAPAPAPPMNSSTTWIVVAILIAICALIAGGALALLLR